MQVHFQCALGCCAFSVQHNKLDTFVFQFTATLVAANHEQEEKQQEISMVWESLLCCSNAVTSSSTVRSQFLQLIRQLFQLCSATALKEFSFV